MRFKQYITLWLCIVLMLMLGSMPLSLASHSIDHHHHSAQTHTTGICAWMCTAAQSITTDSQILSPNSLLLEIIPSSRFSSVSVSPKISFPARPPPLQRPVGESRWLHAQQWIIFERATSRNGQILQSRTDQWTTGRCTIRHLHARRHSIRVAVRWIALRGVQ